MTIRVGVIGAGGRMGREVCRAVDAAGDLVLACAVDPAAAGSPLGDLAGVGADVSVVDDLDDLVAADVSVAVDFTHPDAVVGNTLGILGRGIHAVVGTTGLGDDDLARIRDAAGAGPANAFVAPNFAIGAVLMMQFAAEASRHMPTVEIIELHHDGKADAPSGTAIRTADLVAEARGEAPDPVMGEVLDGARGAGRGGVRIHSVRLPGLVAHQEVILGGTGQTLTIRHDSTDRSSFMPGVLLAVRRIADLDGLVVGLEHLLD